MRSNSSSRPVGQAARIVDLPALEEVEEDVERWWPGGDTDRSTGLGESFRDGEAEAAVVSDAGDQRAAAGEVNIEHEGDMNQSCRTESTAITLKTILDCGLTADGPTTPRNNGTLRTIVSSRFLLRLAAQAQTADTVLPTCLLYGRDGLLVAGFTCGGSSGAGRPILHTRAAG